MALVEVSPIQLPGEQAVVAIAQLFTEFAKNNPDQAGQIAQRFLDLTAPYHALNVAISQNIAAFLARLLKVDKKDISVPEVKPLTLTFTSVPAKQEEHEPA